MEIFDPTISPVKESISYAPRPKDLNGLRVGLIENTKHNSAVLLLRIAERLKERFGMEMVLINRKRSAGDHVTEDVIEDLKEKADFVIAGIGVKLPESPSINQFWNHLQSGRSVLSYIPPSRFHNEWH